METWSSTSSSRFFPQASFYGRHQNFPAIFIHGATGLIESLPSSSSGSPGPRSPVYTTLEMAEKRQITNGDKYDLAMVRLLTMEMIPKEMFRQHPVPSSPAMIWATSLSEQLAAGGAGRFPQPRKMARAPTRLWRGPVAISWPPFPLFIKEQTRMGLLGRLCTERESLRPVEKISTISNQTSESNILLRFTNTRCSSVQNLAESSIRFFSRASLGF
jgi:hypothetical protein